MYAGGNGWGEKDRVVFWLYAVKRGFLISLALEKLALLG